MIGFLCFLAGPPGWIAYALMRSRDRRREACCATDIATGPERDHSGDSRTAALIVIIVLGVFAAMVIGGNLPDGVGEPRYIDGIPVPTERPAP